MMRYDYVFFFFHVAWPYNFDKRNLCSVINASGAVADYYTISVN